MPTWLSTITIRSVCMPWLKRRSLMDRSISIVSASLHLARHSRKKSKHSSTKRRKRPRKKRSTKKSLRKSPTRNRTKRNLLNQVRAAEWSGEVGDDQDDAAPDILEHPVDLEAAKAACCTSNCYLPLRTCPRTVSARRLRHRGRKDLHACRAADGRRHVDSPRWKNFSAWRSFGNSCRRASD